MQVQLQILPAETIPLGQGGGGIPAETFYILLENFDNYTTEGGDRMIQE